ncbi:exonuclease R569 [Paramuricea clavata]|uniref:Exonuclease R569 n=1 Tax=Paramuricea clavata TaxID=317549 RepID=A0A6S7FU38_PARCT|nr:exonuclease R569 [Paramuricea clavata]
MQVFPSALKENIKFSRYTGDDDSTTEAHIRQKVSYGVEKLSDVVHTKRSLATRLYNLSQRGKFQNSSVLSQKVINYLVKCFSYGIAQNKGNSKKIQSAIRNVVPHAFGKHDYCDTTWCHYKEDPGKYKHKSLPYGKDLYGDKLEAALQQIFKDYSTDIVAEKLAPLTNSQRNESLNGVIGSKNPKIRFYGGSESSDFRVACGVAQTNLRYGYINKTLQALNIEPGRFCEQFNERMTQKLNHDKSRKSTVDFKRRRSHMQSRAVASTSQKEAKEGITYQTSVGLNLDPNSNVNTTLTPISSMKINLQRMPDNVFKEIENLVPPHTSRPQAEKCQFNEMKHYNFLVFDIETNAMGKSAEVCQIAVTDKSGSNTLSQYILPTTDIDFHASKVNKLQVVNANGQKVLLKSGQMLPTVELHVALDRFLTFVSETIDQAKAKTQQDVHTILIGHNVSIFDVPILLRHAGEQFASHLQSLDVWFADSIPLFKNLTKAEYPLLKNGDGSFPKINQSSIYESLFNESFLAHDALEDVIALKRILFSSKLKLPTKSIVENSCPVSVRHAVDDMKYLDHRHNLVQSFQGKLFNTNAHNPSVITKGMVEKIAGSGLSYTDLEKTYRKFGQDGLFALLSKPPSSASTSAPKTTPRVTRTDRILAAIVQHFKDTVQITA